MATNKTPSTTGVAAPSKRRGRPSRQPAKLASVTRMGHERFGQWSNGRVSLPNDGRCHRREGQNVCATHSGLPGMSISQNS
jgi:hypothetical protein